MMRALIHEGIIIQIEESDFPVAAPLRWIDCPTGTEPGDAVNERDEISRPAPLVDRSQERIEDAKGECSRRIFDVVDEITQINLASNAAAGLLTPAQNTTYRAGLSWIGQMRTNARTLAADLRYSIAADRNWPAPPAGLRELAAQF